jgi:holo-[acyl-carrier protein] synthase
MAFPLTAIGLDLVEIRKVKRLWDRHGNRISGLIFTDRELKELHRKDMSGLSLGAALSERQASLLAAKFAAKEATIKVLSLPYDLEYKFSDIEIVGLETFSVELFGSLPDYAEKRGIKQLMGGSATSDLMAVAIVIGGSDGQIAGRCGNSRNLIGNHDGGPSG